VELLIVTFFSLTCSEKRGNHQLFAIAESEVFSAHQRSSVILFSLISHWPVQGHGARLNPANWSNAKGDTLQNGVSQIFFRAFVGAPKKGLARSFSPGTDTSHWSHDLHV